MVSHPLGRLSPARFLAEYWQKKPLLIKKAFPHWRPLLTPDELAGLACEKGVESRLVLEKGKKPWQVLHGPFKESAFSQLPSHHWALLVQGVDRLIPEVADLLQAFRFIPNWRLDDVMISYAPDQGGVGPHVDQYDVFLIQGLGRREWQVGRGPVQDEEFIPDLDLRILKHFKPARRWVLEEGDMLYLPPRWAHCGVAVGDCMTYSIGFRAPSHGEVLQGFARTLASVWDQEGHRYEDPDLRLASHPGSLSPQAIRRFRDIIREAGRQEHKLEEWLGCFLTEPKSFHAPRPDSKHVTTESLQESVQQKGWGLQRAPGLRTAFIKKTSQVMLFIEGEGFALPAPWITLAHALTDQAEMSAGDLQSAITQQQMWLLLRDFVNRGWWDLSKS